MKKLFPLLSLFVLLAALQGCMKDSCQNTYKIYTPVYKSLTAIRAEMKSAAPRQMENTGKIYVFGKYIFLNEVQKGIHIIDNNNPAAPKNIGFVSIPGNVDLAVKDNYLYADSYSDIVVLDIANPAQVQPVKFIDNVLKDYGYYWANETDPDSVEVLVGYESRDTTVDCETWQRWRSCNACALFDASGNVFFSTASAPGSGAGGAGGSMARFSIVNDYLYGVSASSLYTFDISTPASPQPGGVSNIGWGIETIYPFGQHLFIGSTSGMFIYNISNPAQPAFEGQFSHASSCDPVVSDGRYAYVTLRSGTECQGFTNQLEVLDIANLASPALLKTYPMHNPHGLSKSGNTLFICDGSAGLKVYDAADVNNLQLLKTIGMEAYDIIARNGLAIVVAKDGLYQFDYSNIADIRQLSKLAIKK